MHTRKATQHLHVLVIDDSEMDNELYGYVLRRDPVYAYKVAGAFSAKEARHYLKHNSPDCILLDYHLPDTERFDFLEELLQEDASRCIILLTGDTNDSLPLEALGRGAADYIEKSDSTPAVLARAVRYAMERHRIAQEAIKLLHEVEKAQELNILQQEFSAMASHEIRSAIASINTALRLMENHRGDAEKHAVYCGRIKEAGDRIVRLSDNTLKLSEMEHCGEINYQPIQFSLKEMLEKLMEEFQSMHQDRKFEVDIGSAPELFRGDPNLCQQMFTNLLSNAVKYSPPAKAVVVKAVSTPDKIEIAVQDEGIGIPQESMCKLFTKFYRGDNAKSINGTGIGLHLTKMLVERHEGSIDVASEPGKGTIFVLRLPHVA